MANRRWGRHPERTMCRITRKGLDYVFMELETEFLSTDVYRYYVDGLIIVYYTFDIQLLSNDIFDHVHLSNEDIKLLGEPEDMLYQRILKNTVSVFRTNLMPFHIYLNNIEVEEEELFRPIICRLIEVMEKIKYEVSDTKHTVVNFSQSIDILSLYHKGGISNEYKVYR
jgi:hypothetical protein